MRKILFLDIDGVLNHRNSPTHNGMYDIDESLIPILARIVETTGAEIVLSSTWRLSKKNRDRVRWKLKAFGLDFADRTDDLRNVHRSVEILKWLSEHKEVEKFAILDDDIDAGTNGLGEYFFRTNWDTGLTDEIADKVIDHLGRI